MPSFIGVWLVILHFEQLAGLSLCSRSKRKITSQTPMNGGNFIAHSCQGKDVCNTMPFRGAILIIPPFGGE